MSAGMIARRKIFFSSWDLESERIAMHPEEFLRLIDSIQMEKGIQRELLFESIETALASAARKKFAGIEELRIKIDRKTGEVLLLDGDKPLRKLDPSEFGRIAAQTAKQIMIQKIREAESEVVYGEYITRENTLVNGVIQRIERGSVICSIGKADGILPKQEQVPTETYRPGERIRCYVIQVKKKGNKVMILLSRTHPNLVTELFALEVPEISEHIVEIKGIVREPGYRTKIAVASSDSRVDAVGACVGVRGCRIRNIVEELNGEKIDIVRWNESPDIFIRNALSPAEVEAIEFDKHRRRARVIVPEDQLSLAIGKKGQNVRLSSKLTTWDLDIMTVDQHRAWRERGRQEIASLPNVNEALMNNLLLSGFECFRDIVELGVSALQEVKGISEKQAQELYDAAVVGYQKRLEEEARLAAEMRAKREGEPSSTESSDSLAEDSSASMEEPSGVTEPSPSAEENDAPLSRRGVDK